MVHQTSCMWETLAGIKLPWLGTVYATHKHGDFRDGLLLGLPHCACNRIWFSLEPGAISCVAWFHTPIVGIDGCSPPLPSKKNTWYFMCCDPFPNSEFPRCVLSCNPLQSPVTRVANTFFPPEPSSEPSEDGARIPGEPPWRRLGGAWRSSPRTKFRGGDVQLMIN